MTGATWARECSGYGGSGLRRCGSGRGAAVMGATWARDCNGYGGSGLGRCGSGRGTTVAGGGESGSGIQGKLGLTAAGAQVGRETRG